MSIDMCSLEKRYVWFLKIIFFKKEIANMFIYYYTYRQFSEVASWKSTLNGIRTRYIEFSPNHNSCSGFSSSFNCISTWSFVKSGFNFVQNFWQLLKNKEKDANINQFFSRKNFFSMNYKQVYTYQKLNHILL